MEKFKQVTTSNHPESKAAAELIEYNFEAVEHTINGAEKNPERLAEILCDAKDELTNYYSHIGANNTQDFSNIDIFLPQEDDNLILRDKLVDQNSRGYAARLEGTNSILVDSVYRNHPNEKALLHLLRHELVHVSVGSRLYLGKSKEDNPMARITAGFNIMSNELDGDFQVAKLRLGGFNEAMTEEINQQARLYSEKQDGYEFSPKWVYGDMYQEQRIVLMQIINGVSTHENCDVDTIWKEFVQKYIDQDFNIFKRIARVYGSTSIRVLEQLGTYKKDEKSKGVESDNLCQEYFNSSTTPERRSEIESLLFD